MSYVYIIAETGQGLDPKDFNSFKVGITSASPIKRLKALQTGNSKKLNLISFLNTGKIKWAIELEKSIHAILASSRLSGEWFAPTNEVKDFVFNIFPNLSMGGDFYSGEAI